MTLLFYSLRNITMLRRAFVGIIALFLVAGVASAADKEVTGTIVKVEIKASKLIVKTADGEKTFDVNAKLNYRPEGRRKWSGHEDDRSPLCAEVKLVIAGDNSTHAAEVHLPLRKPRNRTLLARRD